MFGKGHRPQAGWSVASGVLEEDPTVRGYLARHVEIHGRCQLRDCRRSCHLDFEKLIAADMADLAVRVVRETYMCSRLDRCGLMFEEKPEFPLTLGELTGRDYVRVQIRCGGCHRTYVTNVEGMIGRLKLAGQGDGASKVRDLGGLIRGACGKCKTVRWDVQILWYDPTGHKVPTWKQEFDRRRELAWQERSDRPGPPNPKPVRRPTSATG